MKKTGNIVLFFLLLASTVACAQDIEVHLSVTNAQHVPVQEVGVNKPFFVEVKVNGVSSTDKVYVETHNGFDLRAIGTTSQMNSINGVATRSVIHQYSARPKELGTYAMGPAVITINGQLYTSNKVEITVVDQPVERVTLKEPKLELVVPKGPIVIGQTIPLALRFYHLGTAQLTGISSNQIPGFSNDSHEGPFAGTANIDGVPHEYIEWRTHIVAHQEGTFVFEPARAVYSMPSRERTSLWQQLSDRFSFGMQQYETYSPVVQVVVEPLPVHNGPVDAVGTFTALHAMVNQSHAKQGEGIVYTLELTGDMALKELAHPTLTLPDTITAYESKSSILPANPRNPQELRKQFEYVLQARTPGSIEVPEQTITFYDPSKSQYQQVTSESIRLEITHGASQHKKEEQVNVQQTEATELSESPQHLPLFTQGVAEFRTDAGMNDQLFWILALLIALALGVQWALYSWQQYRLRNADYLRAKVAYHTARKNNARCRAQGTHKDLYGIFTTLYADRHGITSSQVTDQDLFDWLKVSTVPLETQQSWQHFITSLQAHAFGTQAHDVTVDLGAQADSWLTLLEKTV